MLEPEPPDSALGADRRVAHYLPQWTNQSAPPRATSCGPASRISGPLGSALGQHRHRDDLAVRTAQPTRRLYTPTTGLFEAVLRASPDPTCMLAFWLQVMVVLFEFPASSDRDPAAYPKVGEVKAVRGYSR